MKLIFLGPPGAGKGTLSAMAKDRLGLPHISTGDLFRSAIKQGTPLGRQVQEIVSTGGLVPDALTVAIVREKLESPEVARGFILDGFPRTVAQAEALDGFCTLDWAISFELDRAELLNRLGGRMVCKNCGAVYHRVNRPPQVEGVCDLCGGAVVVRPDDEPAAIERRLDLYEEQTAPLIAYYEARNILRKLDASPAPEVVLEHLLRLLNV